MKGDCRTLKRPPRRAAKRTRDTGGADQTPRSVRLKCRLASRAKRSFAPRQEADLRLRAHSSHSARHRSSPEADLAANAKHNRENLLGMAEASNDRHPGTGDGCLVHRPEDLAGRLSLFEGRRGHDGPLTAPSLAAGDAEARSARSRAGRRAGGGARRLQPPLRARCGRPGLRWVRAAAGMVDQIRDALAPIHDSVG